MQNRLWRYLFVWVIRRVLALRYDIQVRGLSRIAKKQLKKESGILFLPNHPAEIDPVILMSILARTFKPRPLVVEHFYYMPGVHTFMRLVDAFPIPHVETTANQWKIRRVEKAFTTIKQGLKQGQNFLLYPSGSLKREGYEVIGGNSFVHRLIHECPDVKIVLIRTTGLWGSAFSRAITGEVPNFWRILMSKVSVLLKNWIFFLPRRVVRVEFAIDPEDFPRQGSRLEINKYLEAWYNRYAASDGSVVSQEPLTLVSYARGKKIYPEVTYKKTEKEKVSYSTKKIEIPADIKAAVMEKISELAEMPRSKIKEEHHLANDLGLDSLDAANIYTFLDIEYGVRDIKPETIETVADVMQVATFQPKGVEEEQTISLEPVLGWPHEEERPRVERPDGSTLQEAFLRVCDRFTSHAACADANSGVMSYKKLKLAALVLSQTIRKYPGEYVGIMLPSSIGAYLTIFATLLAGKVPVMLNWTAGVRTLDYAVELLQLKAIISSTKFLNKVDSLDMGDLEKLVVTLEDIKHGISLKDKLKGVMLSRKSPRHLLTQLGLSKVVREEDPAVILFTSGTETYPKAVPLTHKNLLDNQKVMVASMPLHREDVFYGVLPPFHSFGFNVTGILPLLLGIRVYYAPDPTNAKAMAKDVSNWHATIFCCAPSFFKNLFLVATPKQLGSVRLFVTGAEKAPQELFESVAKLGGHHAIIEGYGITECSPVVTFCKEGKPPVGVGCPLPNLELCTIHPETHVLLPKGTQGEICIHGSSVFKGYLGNAVKDPFIELEGKRWYRSGDLGYIDEEGRLILSGRLKRFVKIGGEMVSLSALEEELVAIARKNKWLKEGQEGPALSIGVSESSERPNIVLFTTFAVTKDEVNMGLRESGFGRIMKITEVKQLKEIPVTGAGKIHYRRLNELASS